MSLNILPLDIENIIKQNRNEMEHSEKYKKVLKEMKEKKENREKNMSCRVRMENRIWVCEIRHNKYEGRDFIKGVKTIIKVFPSGRTRIDTLKVGGLFGPFVIYNQY